VNRLLGIYDRVCESPDGKYLPAPTISVS